MFGELPLLSILVKSGISSWAVVFILMCLSVGVWAVMLLKWVGNRKKEASFRRWLDLMGGSASFQDLLKLSKTMPNSQMARISQSALDEMQTLSAQVSRDTLDFRGQLISESIERAVDVEKQRNDHYLVYLAFCSATAPVLGLLGTIWGIMNAFYAIGQQGSASLTVVAPGIAEALVTTLVGLLVAIPASIGYNVFVAFNRKAEAIMYRFGSELVSLFKRGDLTVMERGSRPVTKDYAP